MQKHRKVILIIFVALIVVLFLGSALFRQQDVTSVPEGSVAGAVTFLSPNLQMIPGSDQTITIRSNIDSSSVDGFQIVADITGNIPNDIQLVPSDLTAMGLRPIITMLAKENGEAQLILIFITINPSAPIQASGDIELGKLIFTAPTEGEMTITADQTLTKVIEHSTGANIATFPASIIYKFTNTPASSSTTSGTSTTSAPAVAAFASGNPAHKETRQNPATSKDLQMLSGFYDEDGETDIAIFDPATGIWYIRYTDGRPDGSIIFGWTTTIPIGGSDFDGDGRTDLAIFDTASGHWYIRPSEGGTDWDVVFGWTTTLPVGGMKYDDDERADLALYDVSSGHWYIRPSKGGKDADVLFGWGSTIPIGGGYYDGDLLTDLALFDRNTGYWHIRHSSGAADTNVPFGWTTTLPIGGGKYDGDNKTDLAIFDPNTGHWYVRPSAGGADWYIAFGWLTTAPIPGLNSDGDTRTDLAIFDKSWGHWYIRPSQGSLDKFITFGWRGVIPL